ncbi:MAG: hypothetical protein Ct9H300mP1_33150 [Planctomycetaceae bacterium]|nr:MAG: hypothetical protein Ct9H300mP1_33150 [Planctomycetaceae bacterium]
MLGGPLRGPVGGGLGWPTGNARRGFKRFPWSDRMAGSQKNLGNPPGGVFGKNWKGGIRATGRRKNSRGGPGGQGMGIGGPRVLVIMGGAAEMMAYGTAVWVEDA